jgi:hypothetical protein
MSRYLLALLIGCGLVAMSEWRTDEDIITMTTLLVASFILGFYRPRLFILSAICVGSVVAMVSLLSLLTGYQPVYQAGAGQGGGSLTDAASMLVLIGAALPAAWLGGLVRPLLQSSEAGRSQFLERN